MKIMISNSRVEQPNGIRMLDDPERSVEGEMTKTVRDEIGVCILSSSMHCLDSCELHHI